jgi:hypothetical protein
MKKKLKISNLEVTSFITSLDSDMARTVKGGDTHLCIQINRTILTTVPDTPTDPVMACDPRYTVLTNCTCSAQWPSLRVACPTIDIECV